MKRADHVLCLLALAIVFVDAARAQAPPKQAVVETSAGTFVIDLAPDAAPNQTISSARQPAPPLDGQYTAFGRVIDGDGGCRGDRSRAARRRGAGHAHRAAGRRDRAKVR